jgi:poly(3-hydroxybutyrate) depolymerase
MAPACGKAPPVKRGALVATTSGRTFRVYPPSGYDSKRRYPVLFAYHGIDSNSAAFQAWFRMEDHVNGEAFVVYPDARRTSYGGTAWDLTGDRDATAFDEMRSAIAAAWCIEPTRVYAMGFSFGGKFVTTLACKRPLALRAISSSDADWGAVDPKSCAALPVLVTHRTSDPDQPIEWGRASAEAWARIDGCDDPRSAHVTDEAHGCVDYVGCKREVTFCEDRYVNKDWPKAWNHTVREEYRDLVWKWLRER